MDRRKNRSAGQEMQRSDAVKGKGGVRGRLLECGSLISLGWNRFLSVELFDSSTQHH